MILLEVLFLYFPRPAKTCQSEGGLSWSWKDPLKPRASQTYSSIGLRLSTGLLCPCWPKVQRGDEPFDPCTVLPLFSGFLQTVKVKAVICSRKELDQFGIAMMLRPYLAHIKSKQKKEEREREKKEHGSGTPAPKRRVVKAEPASGRGKK